MSTPLVLDASVRQEIRDLCDFAAAQPVDVREVAKRIKTPAGKADYLDQMTRQTIRIPMAYIATFSIETGHPCGTCRHLSLSVDRPDRIPNFGGLWFVAREFGFWDGLDKCSVWPEELQHFGAAMNVVQPVDENAKTWTDEI